MATAFAFYFDAKHSDLMGVQSCSVLLVQKETRQWNECNIRGILILGSYKYLQKVPQIVKAAPHFLLTKFINVSKKWEQPCLNAFNN